MCFHDIGRKFISYNFSQKYIFVVLTKKCIFVFFTYKMCFNLNINIYYNKNTFVICYLDMFISIQMH